MPAPSETLCEWSTTLDNGAFEETHGVVRVRQLGQRRAWNRTSHDCLARGRRDAIPVVVTYHQYFQPLDAAADGLGFETRYWRNVLEVFVACEGLRFDGTVRRKTGWDRLLERLHLRSRAAPHPLFAECHVTAEDESTSFADFTHPAFCDAVMFLLRRPEVLWLDLQSRTGATGYFRTAPGTLVPALVEADLQAVADVVLRHA